MSFSVGIVGLPNVGKSTLFQLLTKKQVEIADYPFTTIKPNYGVVAVPDKRLEELAAVIKPEKVTPTIIEFVDIAGLIRGAHKGEGLGNQFLGQIRNCSAILEVIRCFGENVDPQSDIETVRFELEMKDRESKEIENLLTKKPVVYLLNINGKTAFKEPNVPHLAMNLKEELEISDLSEREKQELGVSSQLEQLIKTCYSVLELITFFTITGGKETRAWTIKQGSKCPEAGGKVHSDFQKKFIRAEVVSWENLVQANGWKAAREKGLIQTIGRDYVVGDGDVIEFKI